MGPGKGSDNVAALMVLTAIAHHADPDSGLSRLTYDQTAAITGLSRAKISGGLDLLEERGIIHRNGTEEASSGFHRTIRRRDKRSSPRGGCINQDIYTRFPIFG